MLQLLSSRDYATNNVEMVFYRRVRIIAKTNDMKICCTCVFV